MSPLPKPRVSFGPVRHLIYLEPGHYFTADQMRAYAAEQVAAERERCAKLCEAQLGEPASREWNLAVKCCASVLRA